MAGHGWGSTGHGEHHGRSQRRRGTSPTPAQRAERQSRAVWARTQPCRVCGSHYGVELRYDTNSKAMEPLCQVCNDVQGTPF